jgi:antitoxin ParD1/3/4
MPTRNVDLTEYLDRFVEAQVASGKFADTSEVVRAGLRLLEQYSCEAQERLAAVRTLAKQAFDELDQGQGILIDDEEQLAEFITEVGSRAATRAESSSGPT